MIAKTEFEEYILDVLRGINLKLKNIESKINESNEQNTEIEAQINQVLEYLEEHQKVGCTTVKFLDLKHNKTEDNNSGVIMGGGY